MARKGTEFGLQSAPAFFVFPILSDSTCLGMKISATAIIAAGGAGLRMGLALPKQFSELAGLPLLVHTLRAVHMAPSIEEIVLVAPTAHLDYVRELTRNYRIGKIAAIVAGGRLRQDSVRIGLAQVPAGRDIVMVHDGARPFVSVDLIERCIAKAWESGAAITAVAVKDTLKKANSEGMIAATVDRQGLWQAQTPQAVRVELLREAFAAADRDGFEGTDEASLVEHMGHDVAIVDGSERNIKITRPEDLLIAEGLLRHEGTSQKGEETMRIGHGYDAHRFAVGRKLILGGVEIAHDKGLLGHSDADVLTHALCDAILGALGMGDLGRHFPDSDPVYKGVCSLDLLEQVVAMAEKEGFILGNADVTVIAQRPKLASYIEGMREKVAERCRVRFDTISVKATTTEKMGFVGREEGIAVHAVVLLTKAPR